MASESLVISTLGKAPSSGTSIRPTPKYKFQSHWPEEIRSFVFLHDNIHIVGGSLGGSMNKWDCDTGLLIGRPWERDRLLITPEAWSGIIWALALSPAGKIIACGKGDGSVELWDTDGKIKQVWRNDDYWHWVLSLSWSPSGSHIACGSDDGTILIRKANRGQIEVGPIETNQGSVYSLAYSPWGDRIASGGFNDNICIWDSNTGKLLLKVLIDPIKTLGANVTSVVWSSDGTKLYSASDESARVFDSISGTLLHRFKHSSGLFSVALSPKHNVLACVGQHGIAQLWDTESYQPLSLPFQQEDGKHLRHVSFSPDGRYLAYSGVDKKVTLWMVEDILMRRRDDFLPMIAIPSRADHQDSATQGALISKFQGATQQETLPESPSSSCLDFDATRPFAQEAVDDITEEARGDPHNNFFGSSQPSLHLPLSDPSQKRHLWDVFFFRSLLRAPATESIPSQERFKRHFFTRRARTANSPLYVPAGEVGAGEGLEDLLECSANVTPNAADQNNDKGKGKQREELLTDMETPLPDNPSFPAKFDSSENRALWKLFMRARGEGTRKAPAKLTHDPSPEVIEVYAARGFQRWKRQRLVAYKRKHKAKSPALTTSTHNTTVLAIGSSQADPSLHGNHTHAHTSPQGQVGLSTQSIVGYGDQTSQVAGGLITDCNDDDSDSDSSMRGSWNKFLDKICFPCGHYHQDA
ncbi:WD40 repeat-like protein [Rhizopogon salebrosus TDB-379]|nr:WD40 repeat-like protein [Rhizopogon salebrosus TDB-379]